jgi:hypothetical protein
MHDFTFTHTSQREGVRAATTLLINVRCCTGTYRTNSAAVSSNAYQREEYVLHVLHNSITVHIIYFKLEQSKANNFQFQIIWLVCDSKNLVDAIQTIKPKACGPQCHVYLLWPKMRMWAKQGTPLVYKHNSAPTQTYCHTIKNKLKLKCSYARTQHPHTKNKSLDMTTTLQLMFLVSFNPDGQKFSYFSI